MKNGKYTQFLIDLVVLFLSVKTPTIPNSIISKSRTSIAVCSAFFIFLS